METMKGNDVFNYVMKNYYYVKLDLILPESRDDKGCIEFNIIYINDEGSEVMVQQEPEVKMIPVPVSIFMLVYIKLVEAIITKDNGVSKDVLIENSLHPEHEPKLDYPNEYTMWHLNWYKHSYQFLQPFHQASFLYYHELLLFHDIDFQFPQHLKLWFALEVLQNLKSRYNPSFVNIL